MPDPARILLLESDPTLRNTLVPALAALPAAVTVATTVSEALAVEDGFDAAVLDASLPDGNGYQVCKRLLSRQRPPAVLFLADSQAFTERIAAFAAGAVDYIAKWSSPEEVGARVRVHVQPGTSPAAAATPARVAEARERARQDLEDFIIHDVKTPLSSARATLALLKETGALPAQALGRSSEVYDHAAIVMLMLINDLLDLERFERRGLPSTLGIVDLESLMSRVKELLDARLKPAATVFSTRVVPALAFARSDFKILFRVLVNLADNAFKRAPGKQEVSALLKLEDGRLRLSVSDRGPSIPDPEKPRAFDGLAGGGAGLAYCRAAAATLSGRVWVEDRPGGGSVFVMEVPAEKINPA